ncbi:mitochondrial phosphate carrier protein [Diaporthe eres]|nr:mitochondrial phosphate carrier protein [Diaporthe eres]
MASAAPSTGSTKVDAVVQKAAASAPGQLSGLQLYSRFALAGAVCCSITHGALTPVDVVKTRIQLDPATYNRGMIGGFKQVIQNEGAGALLTGFGPTAAGYFLQGAFKFGGYEFFKQQSINLLGYENASNYRTGVYLASSAAGEFFADIALCPLEATRIRLVSEPTYASGLLSGFTKIAKQEGIGAFYAGFGPILFKQIPYTMAKFVVFEKVSEAAFRAFPKKDLSDSAQTGVNLGSGLIAGFAAAIVSQPADTMLSKINKTKGLPGEGTTSRLIKIGKELGLRGSYTGIGARLFMVGTLTAFQFAIYGDLKQKLGATGGWYHQLPSEEEGMIAAARRRGAPAFLTPKSNASSLPNHSLPSFQILLSLIPKSFFVVSRLPAHPSRLHPNLEASLIHLFEQQRLTFKDVVHSLRRVRVKSCTLNVRIPHRMPPTMSGRRSAAQRAALFASAQAKLTPEELEKQKVSTSLSGRQAPASAQVVHAEQRAKDLRDQASPLDRPCDYQVCGTRDRFQQFVACDKTFTTAKEMGEHMRNHIRTMDKKDANGDKVPTCFFGSCATNPEGGRLARDGPDFESHDDRLAHVWTQHQIWSIKTVETMYCEYCGTWLLAPYEWQVHADMHLEDAFQIVRDCGYAGYTVGRTTVPRVCPFHFHDETAPTHERIFTFTRDGHMKHVRGHLQKQSDSLRNCPCFPWMCTEAEKMDAVQMEEHLRVVHGVRTEYKEKKRRAPLNDISNRAGSSSDMSKKAKI